tara:strand:- start:218 stop:433 length:216 start_codon:yes stop_codon:yes gene_type:complete
MFTIEDKEYDENNLSDKGKYALIQLKNIGTEQTALNLKFNNLKVLGNHYSSLLKEELPKDKEKQSDKKETK